MGRYHFVTDLQIAAPAEHVQTVLEDVTVWPTWWRWLRSVEVLEPGDADGVGARYRVRFRTALPYTLSFESTTVRVEPREIEAHAVGDLDGVGLWQLVESEPVTHLRYTWIVRTTKRWMTVVAPLARPAFARNHHRLMRDFGRGLAGHLGVELASVRSRIVQPSQAEFGALPEPTS